MMVKRCLERGFIGPVAQRNGGRGEEEPGEGVLGPVVEGVDVPPQPGVHMERPVHPVHPWDQGRHHSWNQGSTCLLVFLLSNNLLYRALTTELVHTQMSSYEEEEEVTK